MPNYQETPVTGTKWQRCHQVVLNNPYNGQRSIEMMEQSVVTLDGGSFAQTVPGMKFDFNPADLIQLRDPATGDLTGATMSMGEMYVAVWSLYLQKAAERDTPPVVAAPVVEEPAVVEAPVVEEPAVVDAPVTDAPVVDAPVVEEPVVDTPQP